MTGLSGRVLQSFRLASPGLDSTTNTNSDNNPIRKVEARQDGCSGQYFILWKEIQRWYKDVDVVIDGEEGLLVPFMLDDHYEE